MTEKKTYRVKAGQTFGVQSDYGPGDRVQLTEREAAGLLDKLELVDAITKEQPTKKLVTTVAPDPQPEMEPDHQRYLKLPSSVIVALQDGGYFEAEVIVEVSDEELLALDGIGQGKLRTIRALFAE